MYLYNINTMNQGGSFEVIFSTTEKLNSLEMKENMNVMVSSNFIGL